MLSKLLLNDYAGVNNEGACFACRANFFTTQLPSNGCLFWAHYSGFQLSCRNMFQ
jgi:hypothetical protein